MVRWLYPDGVEGFAPETFPDQWGQPTAEPTRVRPFVFAAIVAAGLTFVPEPEPPAELITLDKWYQELSVPIEHSVPKPTTYTAQYIAFVEPTFIPRIVGYRFYERGTEATSTPRAAENTGANVQGNVHLQDQVQIRLLVQETGGVSGAATDDWQLQFSKNTGAWTNLNSGSVGIRMNFVGDTINDLADGAATTNRGTNGITDPSTGSFVAGEVEENNGVVEDHQLTAGDFTEHVWGAFIRRDDAPVDGDTYDLRLLLNGTPIDVGLTPRITVRFFEWDQDGFRFYEDGTEAGSTAIAAENVNISRDPATEAQVHLRLRLQEVGGFFDAGTASSENWELQYSKNSGTWTAITAASTNVQADTTSGLVDSGATTERLSAGTGSFVAGEQDDQHGEVQGPQILINTYTEQVLALLLVDADLVDGDTLDFRLQRNPGNTGITTAGQTLSVQPRITIGEDTGAQFSGTISKGQQQPQLVGPKLSAAQIASASAYTELDIVPPAAVESDSWYRQFVLPTLPKPGLPAVYEKPITQVISPAEFPEAIPAFAGTQVGQTPFTPPEFYYKPKVVSYCPAVPQAKEGPRGRHITAADFNPASGYMLATAATIGVVDGKTWDISGWYLPRGDGTLRVLFSFGRFRVWMSASNQLHVRAQSATPTTISEHRTSNTLTEGDDMVWFRSTGDLVAGIVTLKIDGVSDIVEVTAPSDVAIDYDGADWSIGADPDGTNVLDGVLSQIFGKFDVSGVTAFVSDAAFYQNGRPVPLGSEGQVPYGTQPELYWTGEVKDDWLAVRNYGSGGNFTEVTQFNEVKLRVGRSVITPENYDLGPATPINFASMRATEAGTPGVSTITHDDPRYPTANGQFTHSTTDPRGNGDDNGTVIAAAAPTLGWWVRDAWTDLPANLTNTQRYHLGWHEIDNNDDISATIVEIMAEYDDADFHFVFDPDCREIQMEVNSKAQVCNNKDFFIYEPPDHQIFIRPLSWGLSADLVDQTWVNNESGNNVNEWSADLAGTKATFAFGASAGEMSGDNANIFGPGDIGPWFTSLANQETAVTAGWDPASWWHDSALDRIRIYSASGDPQTNWSHLRVSTKAVGTLDKVWQIGETGGNGLFKPDQVLVGGPKYNLFVEGRAGRHPAPWWNDQSLGPTGIPAGDTVACFSLNWDRQSYPVGSVANYQFTVQHTFFQGFWHRGGLGSFEGIENVYMRTRFIATGAQIRESGNIHFKSGYRDAGIFSDYWLGQISESGVAVGIHNTDPGGFYLSRSDGVGVIAVENTFADDDVEVAPIVFAALDGFVGTLEQPYVRSARQVQYAHNYPYLAGWSDVNVLDFTPNNRPVFLDFQGAQFSLIGKVDGLGVANMFVKFVHLGYADPDGTIQKVDIRDDSVTPANNVLNVTPDPETVEIMDYDGTPAFFSIESTGESPPVTYYNTKVTLFVEGPWTQPLKMSVVEERHSHDWNGGNTAIGDGTPSFVGVVQISSHDVVKGFNNKLRFGRPVGDLIYDTHTYDHQRVREAVIGDPNTPMILDDTSISVNLNVHDILIQNVDFTGTAREVITISPSVDDAVGGFMKGKQTRVTANNITAPSGSTIDVANPTNHSRTDVWFQADGTYYELPYNTNGVGNTTRSGSPRDIERMGYTHNPVSYSGGGQDTTILTMNVPLPAYTEAGDLILVAFVTDGDPGTVTFTGFTLEETVTTTGAEIRLYSRIATAADWDPETGASRKTISWTNTGMAGFAPCINIKSPHATWKGDSATSTNAASSTFQSPAITAETTGSMVIFVSAMAGDHIATDLNDSAAAALTKACTKHNGEVYGWSLQRGSGLVQNYGYASGASFVLAQKDGVSSGSVNGLNATADNGTDNTAGITIEVKSV